MKNITYILGAGASYYSCPIQKELGQKMMEAASYYFNVPVQEIYDRLEFSRGVYTNQVSKNIKDEWEFEVNTKTLGNKLAWDIGYFGYAANKYGTIDIYAKKLALNGSPELNRLKLAVNVFFCLWNVVHPSFKRIERNDEKEHEFEPVDKRLLALFSSIMIKDGGMIRIKPNVRFVTWNYDLQLERAFREFLLNPPNYLNLGKQIPFSMEQELDELQIVHLNGYHGYYFDIEMIERSIVDDYLSKIPEFGSAQDSVCWILTQLGELRGQLADDGQFQAREIVQETRIHISYAWETPIKRPEKAKIWKERYNVSMFHKAQEIMRKSDIIVVNGYSFPAFNKEIDQKLLMAATNAFQVVYQVPNPSEEKVKTYFGGNSPQVVCESNTSSIYLPFDF